LEGMWEARPRGRHHGRGCLPSARVRRVSIAGDGRGVGHVPGWDFMSRYSPSRWPGQDDAPEVVEDAAVTVDRCQRWPAHTCPRQSGRMVDYGTCERFSAREVSLTNGS